jgi:hypothetical protein
MRLKTRGSDGEMVRERREIGKAEGALSIRLHRAIDMGIRILKFNAGAADNGAGGIHNRSRNGAGCSQLRGCASRRDAKYGSHSQQTIFHSVPLPSALKTLDFHRITTDRCSGSREALG